jgi:septum formation protein
VSAAISKDTPLILGSASPRRREILAGLGLPLRVLPGEVDEGIRNGERPKQYLERIVAQKLATVAARAKTERYAALLVADTIVVVDDEVLNKPVDLRDAERLVARLVGRTHTVFTRYAIGRASEPTLAIAERSVESRVSMRPASAAEIARYARTGEGSDKAGAYAAQGIGAFLIERIEGSYTNVVGLPACEVVLDLCQSGLLTEFP